MSTLVSGMITFPAGTPAFSNATLNVMIEAVGMLDAPAQVVAHSAQHHVHYSGGTLPFSVAGTLPRNHNHYNLRVHVSIKGGEGYERGDYLTKRAYQVDAASVPVQINVVVEAI